MLVIDRVSLWQPRYAVSDDDGHRGLWTRRRFGETMTGELDGNPFELRRDGRRRFTLSSSGTMLATAEATARGRWTISVDGSVYELRRRSRRRSDMELRRGEIAVGSIRKGRARGGQVLCDLPAELSPAVQAFIGFVVVVLWNRAAASSGSAVVVAGG
jgi:hypothetical protein